VGQLVERHLQALPGRYPGLHLDAHVLMPDHLHAILWLPDRQPRDLRQVVGLFKAGCTRDVRGRGGIHPALKTEIHPADGRGGIHPALWQRSFYDRVIRDDRELHALRRYIAENPIRWIHRNGAGFTEKGRDESRPYDHDDRAG
jgi:REP element-mobilizing transposase RayT